MGKLKRIFTVIRKYVRGWKENKSDHEKRHTHIFFWNFLWSGTKWWSSNKLSHRRLLTTSAAPSYWFLFTLNVIVIIGWWDNLTLRTIWHLGQFDTDHARRTIWHLGQFDTEDNLTPSCKIGQFDTDHAGRTIWHSGQFDTVDNLTPS